MKRLRPRARDYSKEINVRRDRRSAIVRMTRSRTLVGFGPKNAERTGDWREWWEAGCGRRGDDGKPSCEPGHAYYVDRYRRAAHAHSKVYGRRKQRRRLNRIGEDE